MAVLQRKAVSSVKWTTIKTAFVAAIGPVTQLIKARYLSPAEFAYIAVVMLFVGLFNTVENFGISQAVIQRDSVSTKESSSLFFFNICLAIILGLSLFLLSPVIRNFYDMAELDNYIKLTSLIAVFEGPAHLFRAFSEKHLYFRQLSFIDMFRNTIMLGLVTFFLIIGYGVYGVIYAHLISTAINSVLIAFLCLRYKLVKVKFYFNLKEVRSFIGFGVFVFSKQVLTYLANRIDEVIIGYFLSPDVLGIYYFGKHMLEKMRGLITASFAKVLFPVFSKLKKHQEKLSQVYIKISFYISFVSFPVLIGVAVTANLFVPIIFGEQWTDSVIVFQVYSISSLLLILTASVSTSLLYSVNKPDLVFYIDVVTNIIYFLSLLIFASQGLVAVLIVYSSYIVYKTLILQYFTNKQLTHSFIYYFYKLMPSAVMSLIMGGLVLILQCITNNVLPVVWQLVTCVMFGLIIYSMLVLAFSRSTISDLVLIMTKGVVK